MGDADTGVCVADEMQAGRYAKLYIRDIWYNSTANMGKRTAALH